MKKTNIGLIVLVFVLLLPACGVNASAFYTDKLLPLIIEYKGQEEQAGQTPRGDVPPIISQMIATDTKIQILANSKDVPKCAQHGLSVLLIGTDSVISAAQDWVTFDIDWTKKSMDDHDKKVGANWSVGLQDIENGITGIKKDCNLK